jgi:hypothetical protein
MSEGFRVGRGRAAPRGTMDSVAVLVETATK